MQDTEWIVLDTETTGFASPIFVVELAAQRMRGWQPDGPPFRRMLNHGTAIPPEASRVHGYTREILERDGEPPWDVYRDFAAYVGKRPVAAYNLAYDWDDVLKPEWERLGLSPCGSRGLCMMQLAQRLLDPVPAGNCKLQTLRQYYNLPARGAHTALGDVETVIDLGQKVLRPLAEVRGLTTWNALVGFSEATWFPARIPFGKFKGRLFREATSDRAMHEWLEWLCESSNPRSAGMGRWYLDQLEASGEGDFVIGVPLEALSKESGLVVFAHPDIARLKALIEASRARLAELEADYTRERHAVSVTQARLFELLRPLFQKRDQLRLRLEYRRRFLDTLLAAGEEEAATVDEAFEQARSERDADYERAAEASAGRRELTEDEATELKALWRKLVRLFHPDRFMDDEEDKQAAYQQLTAAINRARDDGDIELMREIANDPQGFMARQGWGVIALDDAEELDKLKQLYEALEGQIIMLFEALDALHRSAEYELHALAAAKSGFLVQVAQEQSAALAQENEVLEAELEKIEREIAELHG
ncbi:MAG: exonuclease [Betaproteobacteria bacterium]|nr:exonuclease [Betaproteobacteria bacterium]